MKKIILLLLIMVLMMACQRNGTSIKVSNTPSGCEIVATYPNRKEKKVQEYLESILQHQKSIPLKADLSSGKEVRLNNGTVFYLRYHPGKLEMELLTERNGNNGRLYFNQMVADIKQLLR